MTYDDITDLQTYITTSTDKTNISYLFQQPIHFFNWTHNQGTVHISALDHTFALSDTSKAELLFWIHHSHAHNITQKCCIDRSWPVSDTPIDVLTTSTLLKGGHPDAQMLLPPLLALGDCTGRFTKHWDPSSQYCKRCEQPDTWNHRLNCCSLPNPCPETPLLQHQQLWEHGWMVESPIRTELLQHCQQLQLPIIPWFPTQAPHYIHGFTDGTAAHASSPQLRLAAGAVWLPHINNAYHFQLPGALQTTAR
jgi:hypothetical protein